MSKYLELTIRTKNGDTINIEWELSLSENVSKITVNSDTNIGYTAKHARGENQDLLVAKTDLTLEGVIFYD